MSKKEFRDDLLTLLIKHAYRKREVVLSSGKKSNFFIDCKQAVLTAQGHFLVGHSLLDAIDLMDGPRPKAVAGVELGGCSLASSISLISMLKTNDEPNRFPLDAIYVRKEIKCHGSKRSIEGNDHMSSGTRVVVVEDVVTTGASTLRTVNVLRDSGFIVSGVVALVDRLEGGREAIESSGLSFVSLFTRKDFPED